MANPNPSLFQPPPALVRAADFTDPLQPDVTWHFQFRAEPGLTTDTRISIKMREYDKLYVKPPNGEGQATIPPVGSGENRREIVPSSDLFATFAMLEVMQHPEEEEDRWSVGQWAHFSLVAPNAFQDAWLFLNELKEEAGGSAKNSPGPTTE